MQGKQAVRIDIGSGILRGNGWFGKKEDYEYDVPDGAISVSLDFDDRSSSSPNIGVGNGNATVKWDKSAKKAYVHAWVNGAVSGSNEVRWKVICWIVI